MEFVTRKLGELAEWICNDGICRVNNLMKLSTSIKTLRDKKMKELIAKESDVKAALQREKERRKQPLEVVKDWLSKVEEAKTKVEVIIEAYEEKAINGRCLRHWCELFELAESVQEEVIKEVDELLGKQFPDGLVIDELPPKATLFNSLSLARSRPSKTTVEKIEEVMSLLRNPDVGKIGVYGMGGIGKTTIMKTVNDKLAADEEECFGRIIWVTVSKDMGGVEVLQSRIGKNLGEGFSDDLLLENDKERRASMLLNKLKEQEKLLLILDDLWEEISLDKVGIPDPERSSDLQSCIKIVVTTRFLTVCDFIKTQANVEIKRLSDECAWDLFKATIDDEKLLSREEIEPLAKEVVRECGGLPLAIITVAPVLRRMHNVEQWRHNLKKMKSSTAEIEGPDGNVFQLLRFSYNHLKGEHVKKCFLYCAFYPEDHRIDFAELIEYWMAEGYTKEEEKNIFETNTWSRLDEHAKAIDILKELTDSCMLEKIRDEDDEVDCVRMHDLVRDLAIQIMGEDYGFVTKAGLKLTEFPKLAWGKVSKISLMNNQILNFPQHQLNCLNLSTLLLRNNPPPGYRIVGHRPNTSVSINFHESFFSQMPALQVLDLSYSNCLQVLPSSLSELTNLRPLYLQMTNLEKIPSLAKLKKLQILDLSSTYIQELTGVEELENLKFLNLEDTPTLEHIQVDAMSKLTILEVLNVLESRFLSHKNAACIPDLTHLKSLSAVVMSFWSYENYLKAIDNIEWNELHDYLIVLYGKHYRKYKWRIAPGTKFVRICGLDMCNQIDDFRLPINIETLCLGFCVLPQLSKIPCIKNLRSLKTLYLEYDASEDCLDTGNEMEPYMLASLEVLRLRSLNRLKEIWKRVLPHGCLENLRYIYVDQCNGLKNLFSCKVLQQLKNIEIIKVNESDEIEQISSSTDGDDQGADPTNDEIVLPKLQILYLTNLSKLQSISTNKWVCESLKIIVAIGCQELRKFPFEKLPALESFYGDSEWWEEPEWVDSKTKTLLQPHFVDYYFHHNGVIPGEEEIYGLINCNEHLSGHFMAMTKKLIDEMLIATGSFHSHSQLTSELSCFNLRDLEFE
ncbi:hypothetical protein Sjap_025509 [Stephania japonica]|uniref:AAA+ ATPase domain-containing protein n=1 Tax=Stephania japonica TaxID=461633 RepID=A0AAP0E500_9MAGN